MNLASVLLAHQGGWDEILLFGGPVVLAIWAIRRVERRGRNRAEEPATDSASNTGPDQNGAD